MMLDDVFLDYHNDPAFDSLRQENINFVGGFGFREAINPIAIVGEAPGQMENAKRQPFVGPAGVELTKTLMKIGIDPFLTYQTNIVKYWPVDENHKTRTPTPEEISASKTYLDRELEIVKPSLVVLCGHSAMSAVFPHIKSMKAVIGHLLEDKYVPVMHPATLLYLAKNFDADRYHRYWKGYHDLANHYKGITQAAG